MGSAKRILRQPLFQFFLIGLGLFLAFGFYQNVNEDSNVVTVTTEEIQWLEDNWLGRWNRPPTPEEKRGLIDQLVGEKALYKAALEMGRSE